jgi:hypothetical protein
MSICPSISGQSSFQRASDSLLSKQNISLHSPFISLTSLLLSSILASQVFNIMSPLIFSSTVNLGILEVSGIYSLEDDMISFWKALRAVVASLSLKSILSNDWPISRK